MEQMQQMQQMQHPCFESYYITMFGLGVVCDFGSLFELQSIAMDKMG